MRSMPWMWWRGQIFPHIWHIILHTNFNQWYWQALHFPLLGGGVPIGESVREADGQERRGGGGHGRRGDPWHGDWRLKSPKLMKKEACFCSLCFVLRGYEIECFFNRDYTWTENFVLLLSFLVVIIFMEANLSVCTDRMMVGWFHTADIWCFTTPYIVSPGSVTACKSERKGEYSI